MLFNELAKIYQQLLREKFPTVYVRGDEQATDGEQDIEVFCIPDDQMSEFMDYVLDELPEKLEKRGVIFEGVVPHSQSATETHYMSLPPIFVLEETLDAYQTVDFNQSQVELVWKDFNIDLDADLGFKVTVPNSPKFKGAEGNLLKGKTVAPSEDFSPQIAA